MVLVLVCWFSLFRALLRGTAFSSDVVWAPSPYLHLSSDPACHLKACVSSHRLHVSSRSSSPPSLSAMAKIWFRALLVSISASSLSDLRSPLVPFWVFLHWLLKIFDMELHLIYFVSILHSCFQCRFSDLAMVPYWIFAVSACLLALLILDRRINFRLVVVQLLR